MSATQLEQDARQMGWKPKEEFEGNPDHWVDAEEFVERGRHVMPLLQRNNEKLLGQLRERDTKISSLEKAVADSQKAMAALEKHFNESTKRQVEEARAALRAELKAARKEGDVDAQDRIEEEIRGLDEAEKKEEKQGTKEVKTEEKSAVKLDPELVVWMEANPWFGTDKARTKEAMRLAEDLRDEGVKVTGKAWFDRIDQELAKRRQTRDGDSKVAEGGGGATSRMNGRKWNSLPPEAKKACHEDNEVLVGEGKRFKTVKDWEDYYADMFLGEAA